ncbi:hypothetical protein N783_19975 [Pontibacillus marinus BH030004 = DSM 16465]|uniref:Major facilitator superfamily (MFS) profile domain-containing protein n=1 Tax=Pontibacillus marinus BH030004 = DSM 16465 TaxID=1385511 RepID=A0A0A5GF68_9BACI|nr:hypothetical protein N783_19975 [Pontibacillus marinus BH030004 = DSM 16465]
MKWIILIGSGIAVVSFFFVQDQESLLSYLIFLSVAGTGIGVALPCLDAFITEGIPKEERGTMTAVYSSMRFIGVAAGPPVAALMMKSFPSSLYYTFAGLVLISLVISFIGIKPSKS